MARFLLRRLINYLVLCLVATFLAFALASLTFEPLAKLQGQNPPPSADAIEAKRQELRLDEPIPQRFAVPFPLQREIALDDLGILHLRLSPGTHVAGVPTHRPVSCQVIRARRG